MGHVTKDERILRAQFRALVSRLFGSEAARRVPSKRKPGAGGMRVWTSGQRGRVPRLGPAVTGQRAKSCSIAPGIVRDLWHEWLMDLDEGEENRRKSAQEERKRRAEEGQLRELERRNEQEQQNFEKIMAAMAGVTGLGK